MLSGYEICKIIINAPLYLEKHPKFACGIVCTLRLLVHVNACRSVCKRKKEWKKDENFEKEQRIGGKMNQLRGEGKIKQSGGHPPPRMAFGIKATCQLLKVEGEVLEIRE